MKRVALLILLLSVVLFGLLNSRAAAQNQQKDKTFEQEVIKVEDDRLQAFLKADAAALDRILDDNFVYTNVNGEIHTKAELIADVRSGNLKYTSMNHSEIRVRVYENTAILTGRSASTYVADGKEGGRVPRRYMNVFFKKNGQWRLVARQETPAPTK